MTRQEAIEAIRGVWSQCIGEFCVSEAEEQDSYDEMGDALRALGVTDGEMAL